MQGLPPVRVPPKTQTINQIIDKLIEHKHHPQANHKMINGLNTTNENNRNTTSTKFNSTQTTSALKNSSSATASGSAAATAGGHSNNQDQTGPEFNPNDICSPHELIGWVDDVLEKLEAKFSRIESDVIERLDVLGTRIDSLEMSMSGLLDGASNTNLDTSSSPKKSNDK